MIKDTGQQWFKEAKYGLFIHWGLYAVLAGEYKGKMTPSISEWIMNHMDIPVEEYEKLAAQFHPKHFDAEDIVRRARDWGMKYLIFTAKHHDGFAMYRSKSNPYNIVDATPFGRDVVKELQLACAKYGLKFGLYYSQAQDWHDPDGYEAFKDNSRKDFRRYLERVCFPQVKELLTEYGDISVMWFDTPLHMAEEDSRALYDLVKSIQPDCLVSGRIGSNLGDYMTTGDNFIPLAPYKGDWEVPATLNETWGFKKDDHDWKSPDDIIRLLLKINGRGGNYLLNVGPDADGNIPQGSVDVLTAVGNFVSENADAIYGTKTLEYYPFDLEWAVFTRKEHKLFVHIVRKPYRTILNNIDNRITGAYMLHSGAPVRFEQRQNGEGDPVLEFYLPEEEKGRINTTVCFDLMEKDPVFLPIKHWD